MDLTKTRTSLLIVAIATSLAMGIAWLAGSGGITVLGVPALVLCAFLALGIQWVAFVPAYRLQTEKFYDLVGSVSYLAVLVLAAGVRLSGGAFDARAVMLTSLVAIWSLRLGLFLFGRVHRVGKDARFDHLKTSWHRFLVAWTLQGLWVLLTALAALVMISNRQSDPVGVWDGVGLALWVVGFGLEVVADRQKAAFSKDAGNRGRFIHVGVWRWSRHPNYAGEILLWTGIFVSGIGRYRGAEWLCVLSPIFVWVLLRFVSGVPILEQRADERWGGQVDYEEHKKKTPLLWPRPPS